MPPLFLAMNAIKVTQRAEITQEFLDTVRMMYRNKAAGYLERWQHLRPELIKAERERHGHAVQIWLDVAKDVREPGKGMDLLITRLRSLNYSRFGVFRLDAQKYLHGTTKDVLITTGRSKKPAWNAGPYDVYLPFDQHYKLMGRNVHFIPQRAPDEYRRHFHHGSGFGKNDGHPLTRGSSTCWGGFGPVVNDAIAEGDVPELFVIFQNFLSLANLGSMLRDPRSWMEEL